MQEVIDALIIMGRSTTDEPVSIPEPLPRVEGDGEYSVSNIPLWAWLDIASSMDNSSLASLMRGLLRYTNALSLDWGSITPIPILHRVFCQHFAAEEPELTAWIVARTKNRYEPFGTVHHGGARNLAEFEEVQRRRGASALEAAARERARQEAHDRRKAGVATERLWNAVRRGDNPAIRALLHRGADWRSVVTRRGSLVALAQESHHDTTVDLLLSLGNE